MPNLPSLPLPWRRFLLGQQLFWALRVTIGASTPCLILLQTGAGQLPALAAGVGGLYVGLLDLPGTNRLRHRTLLCGALLLIACTTLATALMHTVAGTWIAVFAVSIAGGYAMNFGMRAGIMGLNGVLALAVALSLRNTPPALMHTYLAGLAAGALWYVYYSLVVCALWRFQMHRRALADELFAMAEQFRARARCYDPGHDARNAQARLARCQRQQLTQHQLARDLVLGELAALRGRTLEGARLQLFNLFADCVALYDLVLGAHTDFTLLRQHPACHPLLCRLRDRLLHAADALEDIAAAVSLDRTLRLRTAGTARGTDLHAQCQALQASVPAEVFATLSDSVGRLDALRRQIAHTARDLRSHRNTSGLRIEQVLAHYSADAPVFSRAPAGNWRDGPAFAYALRLSLAMAIGLLAAGLRHESHSYWIILTVAVSLRPSFGQSRLRGLKRVQGTLFGCCAAILAVWISADPYWLLTLSVLSLLLSLAFGVMDYLASSFFGAMMVVLVYHLIAPEAHIIAYRVLDTAIGGGIAWTMAHVFPYWESRQIAPRSQALLQALVRYLDSLQALTPDTEIAYRAARREARTAMAALAISIDGMRQDPPRTRVDTPALSALMRLADLLLSIGDQRAVLLRRDAALDVREECRQAQALLDAQNAVVPTDLDRQAAVTLSECAWLLREAGNAVLHASRRGSGSGRPPLPILG